MRNAIALVSILLWIVSCNKTFHLNTEMPVSKKDDRFIAYIDNTVFDTKTGLMWAAKSYGDISWEHGKKHCLDLELGEHHDWRMPKGHEIKNLFRSGSSGNNYIYPISDLISVDGWLWADEIVKEQGNQLTVRAYNPVGMAPLDGSKQADYRRQVLCVRIAVR